MRVPLLVLAVLLSGCLQSTEDGESGNTDETHVDLPTVMPWGMESCQAIVAIVPADAAAVAPYLPEGFTALSFEDVLGSGSDVRGEATLGVETFTCASGAGLTKPVEALAYGSYFVAVEPPEQLREDVTFHFVKLETVVPDEDRRAFLLEAGVPAVDGTAGFSLFQRLGDSTTYQATLTIDGSTHTFRGTAPAPFEPNGSFVEFMETPHGLATWRATYTWSAIGAGPGTLDIAPGNTAATILGSGPVSGIALVGDVTFSDASLTLPVRDHD